MNTVSRIASTVLVVSCLVACKSVSTEPSAVTKVTSTTSFGMCIGYCRTTLEITEREAVLISEQLMRGAGADLPLRRVATPLSTQEWQEIAAAAAAAQIDTLPDRIGCPDCADGGAETLTIVGPGRDKTVAFDFGATIAEVQPLLDRVRALRTRLQN